MLPILSQKFETKRKWDKVQQDIAVQTRGRLSGCHYTTWCLSKIHGLLGASFIEEAADTQELYNLPCLSLE